MLYFLVKWTSFSRCYRLRYSFSVTAWFLGGATALQTLLFVFSHGSQNPSIIDKEGISRKSNLINFQDRPTTGIAVSTYILFSGG
jgi:hypothetical protein